MKIVGNYSFCKYSQKCYWIKSSTKFQVEDNFLKLGKYI